MSDAERWRTFIAIDLDPAARDAAAGVARELGGREHGDSVRWVRPEALHVTLRFLGDVAPDRLSPLAERVGEELAGQGRFTLHLGAAELFPNPRRPRVVVLEVSPPEALTDLAAAVERGTAAAGFESEDRPFRGHLTLGRMSLGRMSLGRMKGRKPPSVDGAVADADCEVGEVVLFRSELRKSGARYTPLERMALGG